MRQVLLLLISAFSGWLASTASAAELARRDLPWGDKINLEEFGAPRIEISIKSRQMSHVVAEIADYTQMVQRTKYYSRGFSTSAETISVPTTATHRVEKKNGIPAPDGRSELYLLYSRGSLNVYYSNEVAGQERDVVYIGSAPQPNVTTQQRPQRYTNVNPPRNPTPAPKRYTKPEGYLSDTLLNWYVQLEKKRERLDVNDPEAMRLFNEEAARYHAEVKRARENPALQ